MAPTRAVKKIAGDGLVFALAPGFILVVNQGLPLWLRPSNGRRQAWDLQ
jgi:hypothetical protein